MSESRSSSGALVVVAGGTALFAAALLAPSLCTAESAIGSHSASSQLSIRVVVPPVLRVLQITPVKDGYEYRIWTNTKSASINGREYRFDRVGEHTLKVPAAEQGVVVVHGL